MLFAKTSLTVKQLIAMSVLLYKASLRKVLVVSLISAVVTTVLNHLARVIPPESPMQTNWLMVVGMVISVFVVAYAAVIMMHQIMSIGRDQLVSMAQSIAFSHTRVLTLALAMIIMYVLTAIGMVLFLFPGIFVLVVTSMVMPLVIFKQLGPMESFRASFELVWGNAWRTLGVIIVPNGVAFVVMSVARLLHLSTGYFAIIEGVAMWLIAPWVYSATLVMYNELMILHYNKEESAPKPPIE